MGKVKKRPSVVSNVPQVKPAKIEKKKFKTEKTKVKQKFTNGLTSAMKNEDINLRTKLKKSPVADRHDDFKFKYNIFRKDVVAAIEGVIKMRRENPKVKNQLFDEAFTLKLKFSCHNVPEGHSQLLRIPLKHSVHPRDAEVCCIVSEVKGIPFQEHELQQEHWEKLFREHGIEGIKKIMTVHELKTEYQTFEQKRRLVDMYDVFLCDNKICKLAKQLCGKEFIKKRKVPIPVRLVCEKTMKRYIEKALYKVMLPLYWKGNCFVVEFGHSNMEVEKLVENVECILEFFVTHFPGGMNNIKSIYVDAINATAIPIYSSGKYPKEIPVPKIEDKLPKAYKTYMGEFSLSLTSDVEVQPDGTVTLKKLRKVNQGSDNQKDQKQNNTDESEPIEESAESENDGDEKHESVETKKKRKLPKKVPEVPEDVEIKKVAQKNDSEPTEENDEDEKRKRVEKKKKRKLPEVEHVETKKVAQNNESEPTEESAEFENGDEKRKRVGKKKKRKLPEVEHVEADKVSDKKKKKQMKTDESNKEKIRIKAAASGLWEVEDDVGNVMDSFLVKNENKENAGKNKGQKKTDTSNGFEENTISKKESKKLLPGEKKKIKAKKTEESQTEDSQKKKGAVNAKKNPSKSFADMLGEKLLQVQNDFDQYGKKQKKSKGKGR